MKSAPILPEFEGASRLLATTPRVNAWMAANAGSGKTTILRNRVIRLLLGGTAPDRLLCLTFTKAAAAEMQDRIFTELAKWAILDDTALAKAILDLTGATPDRRQIERARQLFAQALEAPGGLKIQTIHAFSERILHLFPLEAGVPVSFSVLAESDAHELKDQARRRVLDLAITDLDTGARNGLGEAFDAIVAATGLDGFSAATNAALACLTRFRARHPGQSVSQVMSAARYEAAFGVSVQSSEAEIGAQHGADMPSPAQMRAWAAAINTVAKTASAGKAAEQLAAMGAEKSAPNRPALLLAFVLTAKGEPRERLLTKEVISAFPDIEMALRAEQARLLALQEQRRAIRTLTRSRALLRFADAVLDHYAALKQTRNALDFDDLIAALRRLLADGRAAWVRMKLDGAIDHILVDEAQDTTPDMWDIIKALADDFFSGSGQVSRNRTLFVVGDEKQSIYSFQGARPDVFDDVHRHFAAVIPAAEQRFERIPLAYSYRSSDDLMQGINAIFTDPGRREGLTARGDWEEHKSVYANFPGLIEIWPVEMAAQTGGDGDDDAPVDAIAADHPVLRLANRIARRIAFWLKTGARHFENGAAIRPGDILILVQKRGAVFDAILRALKRHRVPVAGADRLKPHEEIVTHDLLALAEFALLPEDDLTLAALLKSPFCGLDDAALEPLARQRETSLWASLQASAAHAGIARWLAALRDAARTSAPYAFFADQVALPCPAAGAMSGRKALLTRLGADCADAIDALLADAMRFTLEHPPSLAAFVMTQRARESELKRDLGRAGDQVRIMTVHGSKGLEAKIVFLAETWSRPDKKKADPALLLDERRAPLLAWAGSREDEAAPMREAREALLIEQKQEYRRLLYVALTRAEERLYITGSQSGRAREIPADCWYALVKAGLNDAQAGPDEEGMGTVWRYAEKDLPAFLSAPAAAASVQPIPLPAWMRRAAPEEIIPLPPLRPSRVADSGLARAMSETSGLAARRHGILMHLLFEHLPKVADAQRGPAGEALIRQSGVGFSDTEIAALVRPCLAFLRSPAAAAFLSPNARAEIAVAGEVSLANGQQVPVAARIDRLVVEARCVTILDIKTGRPPRDSAATEPSILQQMALYRALLHQLYPDRHVACHLLWTQTMRLDVLTDFALDAAFAAIAPS